MNNLMIKSLALGVILTLFYNADATLIVRVSEEQFTRTLEDDSIVVELKDVKKPSAFGFSLGQPAPKHETTPYTYITYKEGFYFLTTTQSPRAFNNLVVEAQRASPEVQEDLVAS